MLVQDLGEGAAQHKLGRLNSLLDQLYGLQIDYRSTLDHLQQVFEHYREMRASLLREGLDHNPQYAKAVLISEAIRIYLREIAPKRTKRRQCRKEST